MRIAVTGAGYVGLVTAAGLAELGHLVTCIDTDEHKISKLNRGESPIYEKELPRMLKHNMQKGRLDFTTDYKHGLKQKQIIFVAVGTPSKHDGSVDLSMIETASAQIGKYVHSDIIIVTKSTVPVGTNQMIKKIISENSPHTGKIQVISNPEFLRQGNAVKDFFEGYRIILGGDDAEALAAISNIYEPLGIPIIKTDVRSAEMIKYTANAFLAAKISLINEMAHICEQIGADIQDVAEGVGLDPRIGPDFLNSGIGYGGSCLPKDTRALISMGRELGESMSILSAVQHVNEVQSQRFMAKIKQRFDVLHKKTIAVLGLAFKPGTDDLRSAPSIPLIHTLIHEGFSVKAYDPIAVHNAREVLPDTVDFKNTIPEALQDADAAVIVTDWNEISQVDPAVFIKHLAVPIIFDGRNCFNIAEMKEAGVEYHSIGRMSTYPVKMPH